MRKWIQLVMFFAAVRMLVLSITYTRSPDPGIAPQPLIPNTLSSKERRTLCIYQTFDAVAKLLDKHEILWTPMFGTLLGSVRHGGLIPHDQDADIVVLDKHMPRLRESVFLAELKRVGLELAWHTPHFFKIWPADSPLKTKNTDWKPWLYMNAPAIDVFAFSVDKQKKVWSTVDFRRSYPLEWLFPLGETQFGHTKVRIPRRSEHVLTKDYGPNWKDTISGKGLGHRENFKDFKPGAFKPAVPFLPLSEVVHCRHLISSTRSAAPLAQYNASRHCNKKTWKHLQLIWRLFEEWRRIAEGANVSYTLWAGSLLAARRQQALTPYDTDIDVQIDWDDTENLVHFKRGYEERNSEFLLAIHPRWKDIPLDPRSRGRAPEGFAAPNARLMLRNSHVSQIDIWAVKRRPRNNTVSYYSKKLNFKLRTTSRDIVEPTEPCVLEDPSNPVVCPQSSRYFDENYRHTRVLKKCQNGRWVNIKNP